MNTQANRPVLSIKEDAPVEVEVSSEWLFKEAKTLAIAHAGERYLLRITRQNKLILTK